MVEQSALIPTMKATTVPTPSRRWATVFDPRGRSRLADALRLRVWDAKALAKGSPLAALGSEEPQPAAPRRRGPAFFRDHLLANVIPFWARHAIDREQGGFLVDLGRDGEVLARDLKHTAMQARIVYAFSLAHQLDPTPGHLAIANHGARFLHAHLWDPQHGGWYRSVSRDGTTREPDKLIVNQAYATIALLEHHRASGDPESLDRARATVRLLDEHAWDPIHGGYWDRCRRDWSVESADKTASTHSDITKAILLAVRASGEPRDAQRLIELANILVHRLSIGRSPRVVAACRRDWIYRPSASGDVIDVGQAFKAAATLVEVWRETERAEYLAHARKLADAYLAVACDRRHGGFLTHLFRGGRVASETKLWWTQCEGIVALAALASVRGGERYRAELDRLVEFCVTHFIDEEGEWYTSCARDGRVQDARKGHTWKGPYHSARVGFYGWSYLGGAEAGAGR